MKKRAPLELLLAMTLGVAIGLMAMPAAHTIETLFAGRNVVFRPEPVAAGAPATTTFRSEDNNSVVTLALDSQGSYYAGYLIPGTSFEAHGSTPDGYTQRHIRAQDEVLARIIHE